MQDFVFSFPQTREFMAQMEKMLNYLLPLYNEEGKTVLVVAFGCTGGRHRSVAVANAVAECLKEKGYQITLSHRDISR